MLLTFGKLELDKIVELNNLAAFRHSDEEWKGI